MLLNSFPRLSAIAALGAWMLAACAGSPRALAADAVSPVIIALKPSATVDGDVLRIGDIAELRGGNSDLRKQISELDILDVPARGESSDVSRSLIGIRLKLAGIDDDACRIDGAGSVRVRAREIETAADGVLAEAIRQQLAERLAVRPDDLQVNVLGPVPASWTDLEKRRLKDIRITIPSNTQLGRIRVKAAMLRAGRAEDSAAVLIDAEMLQSVLYTVRPIRRGAVVEEADIRVERVPTTRIGESMSAADVVGRTVRRSLSAGAAIQSRDLEEGDKADNPVLVKPRDVVRLVVRKPGLSVSMSAAEVLQAGRRGDTVQVRNSMSKKVITGRVLSETEVEVSL